MAIVGFMILLDLSRPMNIYHRIILGGCIAGFAFSAYFFHDLCEITTISKECVMLFVVFALITEPVMRYLTQFFGWLQNLGRKKK